MFSDPLGGVLDVLSRLSAIHPPTRAVVPSSAVSETALYLTLARVLLAVHANAPRYNNLGKWKAIKRTRPGERKVASLPANKSLSARIKDHGSHVYVKSIELPTHEHLRLY